MKLITKEEVISIAFNDPNFPTAKLLDSHIEIAQNGFIRPAIGGDFFDFLSGSTPAGSDATFVNNYIKPALAWFVRYVAMPDMIVQATSTGLVLQNTNITQGASDRQAGLLREQAKSNAEILLGIALRYLDTNYTAFPLYVPKGTCRRVSPLGGVIFPRRHREVEPPSSVTITTNNGIVKDLATLRTFTVHNTGDLVICAENNYIYEYNALETSTDDGDVYVKPNDVEAGRWVRSKEIQIVNL